MKTLYKIAGLCLFVVLSLSLQKAIAQFQTAGAAEYASGATPVAPNNTGNDILDAGAVTYEVSVMDDINSVTSGLSWRTSSNQGYIPFQQPSFVMDPDVCLLKDAAGAIYAIAAYYVGGGVDNYFWEAFYFNPSFNQFLNVVPSSVFASGTFGTTLNIDANNIGDFIFVWDTPSQNIQVTTGKTLTGSYPAIYSTGINLVIGTGKNPDVCMYNNSINDKQVDIVYIAITNRIKVDFHRFDDLVNGINLASNVFISAPPDLLYHYPRIACPKYNTGTADEWTVVAEDNDGSSTWYIKGFNVNICCPHPPVSLTVYNDGNTGNSPFNLSDYPNLRPVVTYDNSYNIWVGWNFDNSLGLITATGCIQAVYPIAVVCDKVARIHGGQNYLMVPTSVNANNTYNALSISGRNSTKNLFTYYMSPFNDVYSKTVLAFPIPPNLKPQSGNAGNDLFTWLNQYVLNENLSEDDFYIHFKLYDITGKEMLSMKGTLTRCKDFINTGTENLPEGIYMANVLSSDGKLGISRKLFIGD